ncbi:hypothetical protein Nmel_017364 [Mimus melanotis]
MKILFAVEKDAEDKPRDVICLTLPEISTGLEQPLAGGKAGQGLGNAGLFSFLLQPTPTSGVERGVPSQEEQPASVTATGQAQNAPGSRQVSLPWGLHRTSTLPGTAPALWNCTRCGCTAILTSSECFPRVVVEMGKACNSPRMGDKRCSSLSSLEGSELHYKRRVAFHSQDV